MQTINHQFKLTARPVGMVKRSDFTYTEAPVAEPSTLRKSLLWATIS